jgi:predicted  nucleic acid-binding Zn-ribbon protein
MAVAEQLFRLEQLDADLERREGTLAELRRRQGRNVELEAEEAQLDSLRQQERTIATEQRGLESDFSALEGKIAQDRTRLYGGQVVDPRELTSLERELENYQAKLAELEDRLLTIMEQHEELQDQIRDRGRRVNELREHWEADRPALAMEAEQIADALAGMRAERDSLATTLDPRSLDLYRRLRGQSGHAVSAVDGGVCQWCRVNLPPKDVQHARSGSLVTCTNCGRILYAGG